MYICYSTYTFKCNTTYIYIYIYALYNISYIHVLRCECIYKFEIYTSIVIHRFQKESCRLFSLLRIEMDQSQLQGPPISGHCWQRKLTAKSLLKTDGWKDEVPFKMVPFLKLCDFLGSKLKIWRKLDYTISCLTVFQCDVSAFSNVHLEPVHDPPCHHSPTAR